MVESPIKRVLVSVTDKTGVVDFVKALEDEFSIDVLSTGGTAKTLEAAGVHVRSIEDYTGFPEMMGGRVKTLHPLVHGGLLCRRDDPQHMAEAKANGIDMIDMVVVNLYEFEKTIAKPDVTFEQAIEHIDIGGPSMLRSAAKNSDFVTVVSDPSDYSAILDEMRSNNGATTLVTRRHMALKAFTTTAAYDKAISTYLTNYDHNFEGSKNTNSVAGFEFPKVFALSATKQQDLRYGENPQQAAAVYHLSGASTHCLGQAQQIQGKELSYNNFLDADAAWMAVREFDDPAVIILKHQNPCGSATASDVTTAYDHAFQCDPVSAFGGIIAVNREVPLSLVQHFADDNKQFVEVLIAPSYTPEALERLARRKNLRVLKTGGIDVETSLEIRSIDGALLVQQTDRVNEDPADFKVPTKRKPTAAELDDLIFSWKVCKAVKSNAILVAKNHAGIGMGPGQPNRVDSAALACERAEKTCERMGIRAENLVAASDAFFPFRDCVDLMAEHGITAIIQPGGSIRDDESIAACDEHGIAMIFTGRRHFRH
jgi:phosphoribosylaminoimidazolecarboxamide formyltransferase/IMP cyclohydrolase